MLPIPSFFNPEKVSQVWNVPYQKRAEEAKNWSKTYQITPSYQDSLQTVLLIIDAQNTFCLPEFELYVGGRSGRGAIDDNIRLCEFIYRNLAQISCIAPTMDTHTAMQIFHPIFWVNKQGKHPDPHTIITLESIQEKHWQVNPHLAFYLTQGDHHQLERDVLHYVKKLDEDQKYPLTIWPYHSMLGGVGHALVSALEEAIFFHSIVRQSPTNFQLKGQNPLTENYSILRPEVLEDSQGNPIAQKNYSFLEQLLTFDRILIAGQAKSHCVAWTIADLLTEIKSKDPKLAEKVYLLEDCMSVVVVPDIIDFTDRTDHQFQYFATAGMKLRTSTDFRWDED